MNNIEQKSKKNNIISRFRNRNSLPVFPDRNAQDAFIINTTLNELYNEGDRTTKKLRLDILQPHRIRVSEAEYERIWEILLSTGLVNSIIGFGNNGKLTLTNEGYQLMRQFGSYAAFMEQKEKLQQQQQQQPGLVLPQFIIAQQEEEEGSEPDKQGQEKQADPSQEQSKTDTQ